MNKVRKRIWPRACLALSVFVVLVISNVGGVYAVTNHHNGDGQADTVKIIVGQSKVIEAPWPTIRVAVTDPRIADVQILTPRQVLLQGTTVGSTDLILWNEDETQIWQRKVVISLDVPHYRQKLQELFPNSLLEIDDSGDVLIVRGLLRNTNQIVQLHDFLDRTEIKYVDMTSVAGIQQVQLQIRIAEVSRQAIRALGISSFITDENFFTGIRPGSASGGALMPSINIGPAGGSSVSQNLDFIFPSDVSASPLVTVFAGFPSANLEIFLQALAENQYLRLLANPTLVALSGEEASFLAGGEFPIPVVQGTGGGSGGGTSITIEYKEFGVRLTFRPTVLGDGTIRLYAAPEVSELTDVGAVVIEGFSIPALITRRAETTLELKSGQTFAMAGLIKRNVGAVSSRVPVLGDLPIIGPLFRSTRYTHGETELVVLVTASLVEPMSISGVPPLPGLLHAEPNDWEFFLEGRIEGKEPAKINPSDAEWLRQMGLDQLFGPGAWESYGDPIAPSHADITSDIQQNEDADKLRDTEDTSSSAKPSSSS